MISISELLQSRRKELGLSPKQLSDIVHISVVSLAKYEKGTVLPSVESLFKLANALELNYDELCDKLLKEKKERKK